MQLSINMSDELFLSINESKKNLAQLAKQKLAFELYKNHKISLSQGANFLDTDMYTFMQMLSKNGTPVIDNYDIEAELENLKDI